MNQIFSLICFCLLTSYAHTNTSDYSKVKFKEYTAPETVRCDHKGCGFSYRGDEKDCPLCGWPNSYYGLWRIIWPETPYVSCMKCHRYYCRYRDHCPYCVFLRDHPNDPANQSNSNHQGHRHRHHHHHHH